LESWLKLNIVFDEASFHVEGTLLNADFGTGTAIAVVTGLSKLGDNLRRVFLQNADGALLETQYSDGDWSKSQSILDATDDKNLMPKMGTPLAAVSNSSMTLVSTKDAMYGLCQQAADESVLSQ
jgi:hypothetical protein